MTRLIVIIVLAGFTRIGYVWGQTNEFNNQLDSEKKTRKGNEELKEEIERWKDQCNKVLSEKIKVQTELLENKGRYCRKKHILQSEVMEDNRGYVINMRAEGKTREQIAKELNVSPATVGRALKKWGYYKDIRGRRVGK